MRVLFITLICITLYGCASVPTPLILNHPKVHIGMSKEKLYYNGYGAPNLWSKKTINGKTYETWYYYNFSESFDFLNNALTGYSSRSIYHSAEGDEDVRNYQKSTIE
jgi:hypothetical protein